MTLFGAVWRGVTVFGELVIVPDGSILDFVGFIGFRWICRQREVAPESYYRVNGAPEVGDAPAFVVRCFGPSPCLAPIKKTSPPCRCRLDDRRVKNFEKHRNVSDPGWWTVDVWAERVFARQTF